MHRIARSSLLLAALLATGSTAEATEADTTRIPIPEDMALIPGGEFDMGADGHSDYSPVHRVRTYPFLLDRREVTNAEYARFCEETHHLLPAFWGIDELRSGPDYPNHPVMGVSRSDAQAYATWRGARLPTEAEWEYAARGGLVGKKYSNGDVHDSTLYAVAGDERGPGEVAQFPPNGYGLYDMTGNLCEWVYDRYDEDYYERSPELHPVGPSRGSYFVIRGGGWHTGPGCRAVYWRTALKSNWLDYNVGFRCAKYVGESAALRFEETLASGELTAAVAEFESLRESLAGEFYFKQSELNDLGYRLLGSEQVEGAVAVFELMVEVYPGSYNALDSLAEAYRKQGDRERSIEHYHKALEIHPGCQTSLDALREMGVEVER